MERLRMCIICRNMYDKKQLNRIVKDKDGNIFYDKTGKKNGRGAYICSNEECLNKLCKNKILNKTFKTQIDEKIYEEIKENILGQK